MAPRFHKRPPWLLAAVLVGGAGVGGGVAALMRARAVPAVSAAAASTSDAAARRFRLGEQRRWSLTFSARTSDARHPGDGPRTTLTGQWCATIVGARQGEYDVAYEIASAKVTGGGVDNVRNEDVLALEQRMARRFFVTMREDGAAVRVYFPRDVDPGTRNLLQTIATDVQLVRPTTPAQQWTAIERDGAGSYLASYVESAPGRLTKTKLKYLAVDGASTGTPGAPAPGVEVVIDASARHLTVDPGGGLVAFDGGETTRVDLPGQKPGEGGGISMRLSVSLTDVHVGRAAELVGALETARAQLEGSAIVTHAPSEEESLARADRELIAGGTFDQIFHAAREAKADHTATARLDAWVRRHDDAVPAVADAVHVAAPPTVRALTTTLGRAGTPPAQAALGALAADSTLTAQARADALVAFMLVKRPTAGAMHAVRALLDERDPIVREAARLVTGTMAHNARAAAPEEADALDRELATREAAVHGDLAERVQLLGAMGNSAGPTLLAPLRAAAADGNASVRAAAVSALRLYDDDEAKTLLAETIAHDREGSVRAAAIFSATFRGVIDPYLEPLTNVALHDPVESLRSDAVVQLGRHARALPGVPETLRQVAANDAKPGIRRLARDALARAAP